MEDKRVKFYRGKKARYILEGGIPREGADVAFKPQFINALYFDTENGFIYMNGKRYGATALPDNSVYYMPSDEVQYNANNGQYGSYMSYIDDNGDEQRVGLYRIYSGTPNSLQILFDENRDCRISLDLEQSIMEDWSFGDNALIAEGDKIGLYLGMKQDKENHLIHFGSFDNEGNFRKIGSMTDTDFLQRSALSSVGVVRDDRDVSVLRFIWGNGDEDSSYGSVVDIPLWDMFGGYSEEIKKYSINGKKLSNGNIVLDGSDISVGSAELKDGDNSFSENDNIATALKKISNRLNDVENKKNSDSSIVWKEYMTEK